MKLSFKIVGICLIILSIVCCAKDSEPIETDPVEVIGDHFTYILYNGLSENILSPIKAKLEENYSRVLSDLDVSSMSVVTVRIWNNETSFLDNMESAIGRRYTGASGWVFSASDIRILNRGGGTGQITLHEFCHAVSLVVNNRIGNNPRWLWEAVAIYESGEFVDPKTLVYLVNGNFPTLAELNADFNGGSNQIYSVGYLLSEYIISRWGRNSFVGLIKSNGNIQQTLGVPTTEFEVGWKKFVTEKYF